MFLDLQTHAFCERVRYMSVFSLAAIRLSMNSPKASSHLVCLSTGTSILNSSRPDHDCAQTATRNPWTQIERLSSVSGRKNGIRQAVGSLLDGFEVSKRHFASHLGLGSLCSQHCVPSCEGQSVQVLTILNTPQNQVAAPQIRPFADIQTGTARRT